MYTLQGKTDQHVTRFSRLVYVWPSTIRISRGPRIATFREVANKVGQMHCSREKCSWLHLSARLSGPRDPLHFLSQPRQWSNALKSNTHWWQTTRLSRSISPACDQYAQYLLTGPTHRSLTDTDEPTTLEVPACHIPLPDLLIQRSPLST
jgi:hypothetical protein